MSRPISSPGLFKKQLHILVVDDDPEILGALSELIRQLGHLCATASDGMDALGRLREDQFDIVVTDMKMPRMDGLELIRRIKADIGDNVDVIAITGHHSEYSYTDIIEIGASDFMKKPFSSDELEAKINRISRERCQLAELKYLSTRDCLTGLYSRGHFDKNLRHEAARALRQQYDLFLLLIDVDNFKRYNDKHGHQRGDNLIKELAKIISSNIRKDVDSAYRYGGDEFAVILPQIQRQQALKVAERILTSYKAINLEHTSLSIGLAKLKGSSDLLEEGVWTLLRKADIALYLVKGKGGGQVCDETDGFLGTTRNLPTKFVSPELMLSH